MALKYALIGCGRIAPNHIQSAQSNDLDIVAICDLDDNKMVHLSSQFNLSDNVKHFQDYHKMIEELDIDLIAIATDSGSHAQIALDCMDKNIHLIIEKPIALSLEDAAQGFGGSIRGKKAGSFGDAAITSFFPAKPLGCYGDGGAIFTNDSKLNELISSLKVHGKGTDKYDNVRIGMNSRLDTIQAAILLEKFRLFVDFELSKVNVIANYLNTHIKNDLIIIPKVSSSFYSSYALYTLKIKSNERDNFVSYLNQNGLPNFVYYRNPLHKLEAFNRLTINNNNNNNNLVNSSVLAKSVVSIPIHPYLKAKDLKKIEAIINKYELRKMDRSVK